jgi:hypothetical protein
MAFNVDIDPRVEFEVRQGNRSEKVAHVFAEVSEADLVKYRRKALDFKRRGKQVENKGSSDAAAIWLWDKCIKSVEGYQAGDGADLMTREDWKKRVPPVHKVTAVELLYQVEEVDAAEDADPLAG